jgi:FkbM family methyltransferase
MNKSIIKRISYNPIVIKIVKALHLRGILRKVYYRLAGPKGNILDIEIGGINVKFFVRNPDELRLAESVSGTWGEQKILMALASHLKAGDVAYDIGANIGVYSVILAKTVGNSGKIISFEPEKESYERLLENLKVNNLENVKVFREALGESDKEGKLYLGKTTGNFSLINVYEEELDYQTVRIVKGDSFVKQHNLPIPKAVKIDVEGYEYFILLGLEETLSNLNCKALCCEIHPGLLPKEISEEKVLDTIKSFGFLKMDIYKRPFSAYHIIAYK